jgi:hypothetical protein
MEPGGGVLDSRYQYSLRTENIMEKYHSSSVLILKTNPLSFMNDTSKKIHPNCEDILCARSVQKRALTLRW